MLPVGWFAAVLVAVILLTSWGTFTVTRLDRLHARVDAAQAALDAQLVRRAAALRHAVEADAGTLPPARRAVYSELAHEAVSRQQLASGLGQDGAGKPVIENRIGRAVRELVEGGTVRDGSVELELREAATRVLIARRFYNDAVRDTRSLRGRRLPRLLHLAGRRPMPEFFDIDDTVPAPAGTPVSTQPDRTRSEDVL